jgi:transposase
MLRGMNPRMVNIDRQTPMLLPPDLREWVPADDMVHFVIEAVESMKLSTLAFNRRGSGSEQYPPKMMLSLLIYCYANGIFGSRRIERATWNHLAVRYLTGNTHPDHDTICKFRRENFEAVKQAFVYVLQLARQVGVLKVGTVSIDGTYIKANASKRRTVRYGRALELDRRLEAEIAALLKKAEQIDQQDSDDGQRLPEQIAQRTRLREQLQQARVGLEEQAKAKAQAKRPEYERKLAAHLACKAQKRWGGPQHRPLPPRDDVKPTDSINLTDPDSRVMRKNLGEGYQQCYNAQATVDADGSMLMLATHVITAPADYGHLESGVQKIDPSLGQVKAALADAGYLKAESIAALEQQGVDVYVAVTRDQNRAAGQLDARPPSNKPERVISTPIVQAMHAKLSTSEARNIYRRRQESVEPVFGIIKNVMGFRQFLLRGLAKVSGEWSLVGVAYNFKRLWRLRQALEA